MYLYYLYNTFFLFLNRDYVNTAEKVEGFTTSFNRLMSLKLINSVVYIIGIPGKATLPGSSSKKCIVSDSNQIKCEPHTSQQQQSEPSIFNKLFSKTHIVENNGNSVLPLFELNSSQINLSTCDLHYQLNNNSKNTQVSSDFLQMNLQHAPFNLTTDEISKLNSENQSNNIRLIHKPSIKAIQTNVQITNPSSSQKNIQPTNISASQPFTNVSVSPQSHITNIRQLGKNQLPINKKLQHLKLQNSTVQTTNIQDIQEQHQSQLQETNQSTNVFVQQQPMLQYVLGNNVHMANVGVQKQQQQPVILPRPISQKSQKNILQQEIQRGNSNIKITRKNIVQQPQLQQIRPNTPKVKINIQQRKPQHQTNIRLANVNVSQSVDDISKPNPELSDLNTQYMSKSGPSLSPAGVSIRSSIKAQKPAMATKPPSLEKMPPEDYARLRQTVMASLLQTNPEIFTRGQTVIGEITRSQSTNRQVDSNGSNLQTESQQNENSQN